MINKLIDYDRDYSGEKKNRQQQTQVKEKNNLPVLNDLSKLRISKTKYASKLKQQPEKKFDSVIYDKTYDLINAQNELQQQLFRKLSNIESKQQKLIQNRNLLKTGDISKRMRKTKIDDFQELKKISQSVDGSQIKSIISKQSQGQFDINLIDLRSEGKNLTIPRKKQGRLQLRKIQALSMDLNSVRIVDEQDVELTQRQPLVLQNYLNEDTYSNPLNIDLCFNQKYRNDQPMNENNSNQNTTYDQNFSLKKPKLAIIKEEAIRQFIIKVTDAQLANLQNLRITKQQLKNHLFQRYGERISERFIHFFEFPHTSDIQTYMQWAEIFNQLYPVDWMYFFFFLYDQNEDRVICNTDLFNYFIGHAGGTDTPEALKNDVLRIYKFYVVQDLNSEKQSPQQIQNLLKSDLMKQINLNITQLHRILKRKREQKRITVKRNTIFLNNFGAIDFFINQNIQQHNNFQEFFSEKKPFSFNPQSGFSINFIHFNNIFGNQMPEVLTDIMNYIGIGEDSSSWKDSTKKKKNIYKSSDLDMDEKLIKQNSEDQKGSNKQSFEELLKSYKVKLRVYEQE